MDGYVAIILICLNTVAPGACTEETAADVMSTPADSELTCNFGWQEAVGRSAFADRIGSTAYVKTICRRATGESD
ncbi:hypothetical protein [Rhodospirillaceae bacterium SYSU D60014]|uniref:hypothetical protein n=1 Tax=Virgifigura deserti TaxID=2268457 RepID=UPI000E66F87C